MHGRLLRLSIVGSVAAALDTLVLCGCLCFWSIRPAASVIVLQRDQTAWTVPGMLVLRVDSPIYFANSGYLRERITRWMTTNGPAPRARPACSTTSSTWVRSAASTLAGRACLTGSRRPWTGEQFSIDTSRTSMLDELKKTLDRRTIQIVLANPRSEIVKKLDSSKIWSGNAQSMYHKMMVLL